MTNDRSCESKTTDLHAETRELVDQLRRFELVRIAMRQCFEGLNDLSWGGP